MLLAVFVICLLTSPSPTESLQYMLTTSRDGIHVMNGPSSDATQTSSQYDFIRHSFVWDGKAPPRNCQNWRFKGILPNTSPQFRLSTLHETITATASENVFFFKPPRLDICHFCYPTLGNFWEITKKHTHTHVLGMRKHWYKQKSNAFLLPNPKDPGCQVCFFLRVRDFPPIKDGFETINRGVNSSQMGGNPENPGWVDRSAVTIPGHWSSRLDEQRLDFAMKF